MDLNEVTIIDSSFNGIERALNSIRKGIRVNYVTNNDFILHSLKNGYVKNVKIEELVRYLIDKKIVIKNFDECDNFSSVLFITRNMLENNYDEIEILCKDIAEKIKKKAFIIYNGASFPGDVKGYIEKTLINFSNLEYGKDFYIGYVSPQIIDLKEVFISENENYELRKILNSIINSLWPDFEKVYFPYIKEAEAANIFSIIINEINLTTYSLIYFLLKHFNIDEREMIKILKIKPNRILDEESYFYIIKNLLSQEDKKIYDIKIITHYKKLFKDIFEKMIMNLENEFKREKKLLIIDSFRFDSSFLQKYKRKHSIIKNSEEISNMNEKEIRNFIANSDIVFSYTLNSKVFNRIFEISKKNRKKIYDLYDLNIEVKNNG